MLWRRSILLVVLLAGLVFLGLRWRDHASLGGTRHAAPIIEKQPISFTARTFNPADPPSDMPPLAYGEAAECDTNFASNATVHAQTLRTDATHGIVTVTGIEMTLQLSIVIWLPNEATQHVSEHEDGHRQISEHYYQTADQLAARIAATHMGEEVAISGQDLRAEADNVVHQVGAEITDEYDKELNAEAAQLRFDAITDHARNDVPAIDAVAQALKDTSLESSGPEADPSN